MLSLGINVLIVWYLVARSLRKREARLVRKVEHELEDAVQRSGHPHP